jgi:Family of unknown function (DUF6804)
MPEDMRCTMLANPMFVKIMKFVCAGVLLLAALWVASPGVRVLLDILVCVGALTVATQAAARPKYVWATGFVAIAVLYNPVAPIALSREVSFWLDLACLLAFALSLEVLKSQPIFSIPSITNRRQRRESL